MKDDRETKEKLLASAEHEFMEKGYQGASLRNICKNAGVTTGALYFFFKDKDDIFASLVAPVLGSIRTMMEAHMQIDAFVHLLTHEPDEEKAVAHLGDILKYLLAGWYALFQRDE